MADASVDPSGAEALKICVGAPLSGKGAELGREMANAIQLAIGDANAAVGANGPSLEALVRDDKGDEDEGQRVAEAFVRDSGAVAVIGHYNSNVTLRVAPLYADAGLPLIAPIVSNPALTESGLAGVFRFTNRDDATAGAIASHMVRQLGKRRVIVVASETVYGRSMGRQFVQAFTDAGGTIVGQRTVDEGETEFKTMVEGFASKADAIFYGGTFEGAPLLKAMRSLGDTRLLAAGDGCWDVRNFLQPAGAAAEAGEGVLVLSACPELGDVPGSRAFAHRYERHFGPIGNYAVNSYDAAMTLIDAIRATSANGGAPDRIRVAQALRSICRKGIAYHRNIRWDGKGDNLAAVTALHRVEGGRYRQISVVPKTVAHDPERRDATKRA